ncbi:MAG: hypothetical protein R2797_00115 [Gelidibacter sp.]
MKIDFIPFQLGMQYENWEFELDILPDRVKGKDSYLYTGNEVTTLYGYKVAKIELLFNLDILEEIRITISCTYKELEKQLKLTSFKIEIKPYSNKTILILT